MPELSRARVARLADLAVIEMDAAELDHLAPEAVILESIAFRPAAFPGQARAAGVHLRYFAHATTDIDDHRLLVPSLFSGSYIQSADQEDDIRGTA